MRAGRSPQITRDPGVEGARERPGQKRQRHQERERKPGEGEPEDHRRKPAHQKLALRPDVEEARSEPQREAQPCKHQRNGRRQGLGDRIERADGALQKGDVGAPDRR
jgi:hypothetical protein